ncbi:hypothetical protein [Salipaludibacillus keqinensis]|nr:hypothetical protein [Salipaludibacillus keqinensis]
MKQGVYYKNHWSISVLAFVGAGILFYIDRDIFIEYFTLQTAVIFIIIFSALIFIRGREHLVIYNTSKEQVEESLEKNFQFYHVTFSKDQKEDENPFDYLLPETNEKITFSWDESPMNDESKNTIHLKIKRKGRSSYLTEVLNETIDELREQNLGQGLTKRLTWHGSFLLAATLVFMSFFFVNLLA